MSRTEYSLTGQRADNAGSPGLDKVIYSHVPKPLPSLYGRFRELAWSACGAGLFLNLNRFVFYKATHDDDGKFVVHLSTIHGADLCMTEEHAEMAAQYILEAFQCQDCGWILAEGYAVNMTLVDALEDNDDEGVIVHCGQYKRECTGALAERIRRWARAHLRGVEDD